MNKIHYVREPELLIQEIKQVLDPISDKLEIVSIFGSLANKDFYVHSDVDLFVVSDK